MKRVLICAAGALSAISAAFAADGVTSTWFNETLSDYRLSGATAREWVTTAGRWTRAESDKSVCSNQEHRVYLNTCGSEVAYEPCVLSSGKPSTSRLKGTINSLSKVVVSNAVFTAFRGGDEWSCVEKVPLAGISLRQHDDGSITFVGWVTTRDGTYVKGRWLELAAEGVTAAENTEYVMTVELDQRTIPCRVRYSVNDSVLKDVKGNDWFSIRNASLDPAANPQVRASQVCFNGVGKIGPISAETTVQPVARGTVEIPTQTRVRAGKTELDATAFTYGDGLGANVAYQWYLTDSAGMKVVGSERGTGEKYTVTSADYGHWITVDVSDENGYFGTGRFWCSNLPVVYIKCFDEAGYVETGDELAEDGKIYYWADDEDNFYPLDVAVGTDLSTNRTEHGKLFLANVKTAWPTSKKEDHKAYITITGNEDWKVQYDADGVNTTTNKKGKVSTEETASQIHVRGNSTAGADKKPYKIKLGKKTDLFEMGGGTKNKHWVLLANCFDESLMRNKICYDYSGELGLVYMHSVWVDVVMNGKYVGNYQLCQHIRVAEERINIYDWSTDYEEIAAAAQTANPALTDDDVSAIETLLEEEQMGWMADGKFTYLGTNYTTVASGEPGPDGNGGFTVVWEDFSTDITGGYVFELDWKKSGPSATSAKAPSGFVQNHSGKGGSYMFNLAMNTPEYCFTSPVVSNYVWECWNDIGQAWSSGTGYNKKGQHYSEICDFDSMINYWLAIHVPGNNDAGGLSRYAYKDRNGKVVFGPAWDYDYGLDSLQIRTRRAAITNEYGEATYAPILATGWIPGADSQNFMGGWTWDPYFMYVLREKYWATRQYLTDLVKDGGLIDRYIEYLGPSARANDLRWNNRIGFFGNAEELGDAYVLKEFLTQRFAWLDQQFETNVGKSLPKLTQTACSGGRYSRSTAIVPAVSGATTVQDTVETDLADVELDVKTAPVSVAVTVPTANAAALDVYVNGLSNGTFAVASGAATVEIPAAALKTAGKNFIQFVAKKSDGSILANNVALLKAKVPSALDVSADPDDPAAVPAPVTTDWMDAAYAKLAEADPENVNADNAPKTYADYLAFAKGPSPIGKSTSIWEDFVADTDPSDTNDVFSASIEIGSDGLPRVTWHPDRSDKAGTVVRSYTLRGTNDLKAKPEDWDTKTVSGDDDSASEEFRRTHKFFKVEVAMPE